MLGRLGSWTVSASHLLTAPHWYTGPGWFLFAMASHMRVTYNLLPLGSLLCGKFSYLAHVSNTYSPTGLEAHEGLSHAFVHCAVSTCTDWRVIRCA